ncbi:MAG: hypothetical protein WCU80_02375, partial [Paludibacteraceae bacterium]
FYSPRQSNGEDPSHHCFPKPFGNSVVSPCWHFLTIESLKFYGVAALQAATFAFVVHLMQTLMILIIGFISFVSLPFVNKTRRQ